MKVLDLFSGIGGFSLGLDRAGFETVAFCEIDPYCRQVLAKHWPGVPIHDDIRKLDGGQYRGTVDVVCGGFPCQPFSNAGKQRGKGDDRDLWPEMLRVIREAQPSWVIGENVAGFVNMELDRSLSDLESEGYASQTFDIPACGVDAKHIRHRVWIVAHADSNRVRQQSESEPGRRSQARAVIDGETQSLADTNRQRELQQEGVEPVERRRVGDGSREDAPHSMRDGLQRHELTLGAGEEYATLGDTCRWPAEPDVGRVVNGLPRRVDRIRALGNAVVPQIPEILGKAIQATATTGGQS